MNSERHEELAALAAFDLLSLPESAEFTAALERDPSLQALVASFRETSAVLAYAAPAVEPPAALKSRILARIAVLPPTANPKSSAQVLKFEIPKAKDLKRAPSAFSFFSFTGWAAAAGFAVAALWFGQNYFTAQKSNQSLRDQHAITDLSLRAANNQLAAERLIAQRELAGTIAKSESSARLAATLQSRFDAATGTSTGLATQLDLTRSELSTARAQLADTRAAVTARDARLTDLDRQLRTQGDLANFKIATLTSLAGNSAQALAVAVWNPASQQGILTVQKLPALAPDKDYQLWIVDPQYPAPVDGGVFTVDPVTGENRMNFRSRQNVATAAKFAISLERKGGVPKAEGPILMLGSTGL